VGAVGRPAGAEYALIKSQGTGHKSQVTTNAEDVRL
jgi:hypothetical protein